MTTIPSPFMTGGAVCCWPLVKATSRKYWHVNLHRTGKRLSHVASSLSNFFRFRGKRLCPNGESLESSGKYKLFLAWVFVETSWSSAPKMDRCTFLKGKRSSPLYPVHMVAVAKTLLRLSTGGKMAS